MLVWSNKDLGKKGNIALPKAKRLKEVNAKIVCSVSIGTTANGCVLWPLDETHLVAVEGRGVAYPSRRFKQVRPRGENWASQIQLSGQQIFSTVISRPWMHVCMYVCMYVWMDGWMGGWMDGCMYAGQYLRIVVFII